MTTLVQQNTLFDNLVGPVESQEKLGVIFRVRTKFENKCFTNNPSPYTPNRLCRRILDSVLRKNENVDSIGVFFSVEFAAEFHKRGYKNVVVMTENLCPETKKITEAMGYKYLLKEEMVNKNMKFDIIVGNPPFEKTKNGNKKDAAANLWPYFVKVAVEELLVDGGIVAFITPKGWVTPSADFGKGPTGTRILDYIKKYQTISINIDECKKYFLGIGSTFSYFIIKKTTKNDKITEIITPTGTFDFKIDNNIIFLPSSVSKNSLSINLKVLVSPKMSWTNNNTPEGKKFETNLSDTETSTHNIKCYMSSAKSGTFQYSSVKQDVVKMNKVMVSSSGTFLPVYDNGKLGFGHNIYVYYLDKGETFDSIKSFIESKLIKSILKDNKSSGWTSYALRELPKIDFSRVWTDEELYAHFDLTQEEIDYIEANVK